MNKHYIVSWIIDVIDDVSPEEAARQAFNVMRDNSPDNAATVLDVFDAKDFDIQGYQDARIGYIDFSDDDPKLY